jgi:hypothetical protein
MYADECNGLTMFFLYLLTLHLCMLLVDACISIESVLLVTGNRVICNSYVVDNG